MWNSETSSAMCSKSEKAKILANPKNNETSTVHNAIDALCDDVIESNYECNTRSSNSELWWIDLRFICVRVLVSCINKVNCGSAVQHIEQTNRQNTICKENIQQFADILS